MALQDDSLQSIDASKLESYINSYNNLRPEEKMRFDGSLQDYIKQYDATENLPENLNPYLHKSNIPSFQGSYLPDQQFTVIKDASRLETAKYAVREYVLENAPKFVGQALLDPSHPELKQNMNTEDLRAHVAFAVNKMNNDPNIGKDMETLKGHMRTVLTSEIGEERYANTGMQCGGDMANTCVDAIVTAEVGKIYNNVLDGSYSSCNFAEFIGDTYANTSQYSKLAFEKLPEQQNKIANENVTNAHQATINEDGSSTCIRVDALDYYDQNRNMNIVNDPSEINTSLLNPIKGPNEMTPEFYKTVMEHNQSYALGYDTSLKGDLVKVIGTVPPDNGKMDLLMFNKDTKQWETVKYSREELRNMTASNLTKPIQLSSGDAASEYLKFERTNGERVAVQLTENERFLLSRDVRVVDKVNSYNAVPMTVIANNIVEQGRLNGGVELAPNKEIVNPKVIGSRLVYNMEGENRQMTELTQSQVDSYNNGNVTAKELAHNVSIKEREKDDAQRISSSKSVENNSAPLDKPTVAETETNVLDKSETFAEKTSDKITADSQPVKIEASALASMNYESAMSQNNTQSQTKGVSM